MNNNLNCDNVCDLLELYHDNLVRPTTEEAVSNHLSECENCRKEYEKLKGSLPSSAESSTRKEFARLMKKKKTKQIVTTVICCLLACLILASTYQVLTEAKLEAQDINVFNVYKYEAPDGQDFFLVMYTYEFEPPYAPKIEVKREFVGDQEKTSIVYDVMTPIITSKDYQGPYYDTKFFRADEISTAKHDIISDIDCDELIMGGKVVWSKEANGNDEVPGYVKAFYDKYLFIYNQNEFGVSNKITITESIDLDNLDSDENYICANYPDKIIKWNLKGEVIEETLKVPSSAEY